MELLDPNQPLKVVKKVLHGNYNIGTEGTLSCYTCHKFPLEPVAPVTLAVFIGLHENIAFQFVTDVHTPVCEILAHMQELYTQFSVTQRNEHAKLH